MLGYFSGAAFTGIADDREIRGAHFDPGVFGGERSRRDQSQNDQYCGVQQRASLAGHGIRMYRNELLSQ